MQRTEWMGWKVVYWTQANNQEGLMHKQHLAVAVASIKRFAQDCRSAFDRHHDDRLLPQYDNRRWNAVVNRGRERHSRPPP